MKPRVLYTWNQPRYLHLYPPFLTKEGGQYLPTQFLLYIFNLIIPNILIFSMEPFFVHFFSVTFLTHGGQVLLAQILLYIYLTCKIPLTVNLNISQLGTQPTLPVGTPGISILIYFVPCMYHFLDKITKFDLNVLFYIRPNQKNWYVFSFFGSSSNTANTINIGLSTLSKN